MINQKLNNEDAILGTKIMIIEMQDEPNYSGKTGIIKKIDSAGHIHGTWGGCALIPNVDKWVLVSEANSG